MHIYIYMYAHDCYACATRTCGCCHSRFSYCCRIFTFTNDSYILMLTQKSTPMVARSLGISLEKHTSSYNNNNLRLSAVVATSIAATELSNFLPSCSCSCCSIADVNYVRHFPLLLALLLHSDNLTTYRHMYICTIYKRVNR